MRESIGGTWLFGIVITFIALFSAFLSYAISYTKAFNLKSEILNLIERSEGWTLSKNKDDLENVGLDVLAEDNSVQAQAFYLVKSMGYNYTAVANLNCSTQDGHESYADGDGHNIELGGFCVSKFCPALEGTYDPATGKFIPYEGSTSTKTYYKVTTFISVKIPVVELVLTIPISGETRTLFYDQSDSNMPCTKY